VVSAPARATGTGRIGKAWAVLGTVLDPEVPALSVRDLGIVRDVVEGVDGLTVVVTPTYSGCPATEVIEQSIVAALESEGLGPVRVEMRRAPAWTTDWISDEGRRKLREYGISPPGHCQSGSRSAGRAVGLTLSVRCPRCGSGRTREVSRFGSTPCKSHWTCLACLEPFDHFKAI
jgi:ring-1,2-phenylacetyl-CoA epoxidase subunit PaaD